MSPDSQSVHVGQEELGRRTIRRGDYVSCAQAFIDCKTPGSESKENYSIIGPGVTQSSAQVINLTERHGFNVGAAAMPHGVTNSLHLHFTAEVFLNFRGDWLLRWGPGGRDGEYVSGAGDVVSLPTWIFRGFTNVGPDDGWLFTILGFDDTGGIIWDPAVLAQAAQHGLYLGTDNQLIDTAAGDPMPATDLLQKPLPASDIARLRQWTPGDMRSRVSTQEDLAWSRRAFLCSDLSGGGAELALVIGYGISEDRDQAPQVHNPHNFSLAWLKAAEGEGLLAHRHQASQAVIVYSGRWRVVLNRGDDQVAAEIGPFDTLSVPAGAWRRFELISAGPGKVGEGKMVVVTGGDSRVPLEWDDEVLREAGDKGVTRDAAGYVAAQAVLRRQVSDD